MTADADAPARRGRVPFELLRFTATPAPGGLIVVEIEGRVATTPGRFARTPVLVVEPTTDGPRLELAPAHASLDAGRWRATYALPAESYDAARFALGLRGTLLDLPAPDEPADADRLTALARENNALRRQREAAELDATAAAGELGAAVSAARDEALAESTARISAMEEQLTEAHRLTAEHEAALTEAKAAHANVLADVEAAAAERLRAAEAAVEERLRAAEAAHDDAAARVEARALAAEEGIAVLRAELAEERERLDALRQAAAADRPDTADTALWARGSDDPERTQVLSAVSDEPPTLARDPDDETRPFSAGEERRAAGEPIMPLERGALPPRTSTHRSAGAWVAVAALALFVFVLLGLLLGFLI